VIDSKYETAFPQHAEMVSSFYDWQGMSLRDYFAAKAMASIILDPKALDDMEKTDMIATAAYAMADAMLEARN
jgi:hypothetical protein